AETVRGQVGAYSDVAGVNVFDSEGVLINSSETWPVPDVKIADRAYFQAFKSGAATTPVLIEQVQSRFSGSWATVIAQKVTGPKGEFLGVVNRAISPGSFEEFFASVALGQGAAISMHHRDGTLLARYPHVEEMIGRNFKSGPARQQTLFERDHAPPPLTSPVDGWDRLISARALTDFPIVIVATTTETAALADWREQTSFLIAVAALAVLVVTTMLFLVIRKLSQQHRLSQQRLTLEKLRLDTAVNNMTQGLLLFDSSQRLVVCNQRYIEMYGLSAAVVKPGCSFREIIAHRKVTGSLLGDDKEFYARVLRSVRLKNS